MFQHALLALKRFSRMNTVVLSVIQLWTKVDMLNAGFNPMKLAAVRSASSLPLKPLCSDNQTMEAVPDWMNLVAP